MLITIKLIVYYQIRQECYLFYFKEKRKQMTNKNKSNKFVSNLGTSL